MSNLGLLADSAWLAGVAFVTSAITYTGGYTPGHIVAWTGLTFATTSAIYIHQARLQQRD